MHDPEDDGGDDEGVGKAGDGVSELVGKLDVVVVEPSSRNLGEAVEARNASLGKETGQEVTNDTADAVSSEDLGRGVSSREPSEGGEETYIEGIIVAEHKLELGRKIADGAAKETEEDGSSYKRTMRTE